MMNEWKEVSILDVAPITSKLVDPKDEKYSSMILIAPDHIQSESGQIIAKATAREQNAISGKYLVKKGDVIYSKIRPYLKKVCIAPEDCLCSADMYPFSCTEQINSKYLQTLLLSKQFTDYANSCSARTGIPKINRDDIALFFCKIPPIPEQEKIAETLSIWDSAIQKTEKLISEKEKMFNGISQKIFRKASIKHKISEFLTIRNEKCIPDDSTPLYSLTIENGVTPKSDRYDREALVKDSEEKEYKVVYPGDIVFNPANLRWGAIARSNETKKVTVSPIYEVLQLDSSKINSDYLTFLLTSKDKIRYYATKTEGTLVERMAVKVDVFLNFQIEIEEDNENQKTVSEVLTTLIREISLLKKQLEQYKLQKQGLMQKLLTGEWRVR